MGIGRRACGLLWIVLAASCARKPSRVVAHPPPPANVVQATGSVYVMVRESSELPLPGVLVRIHGQRLGGITDESGRALIERVPVGSVRVQALLLGYDQAEDSVVIREGSVDTLRFRMADRRTAEPPNDSPPVLGRVEPADSVRGPGRLIVRVSPRTRADVTVTVTHKGTLIRRGQLLWCYPDQQTELEFSELPLGACEVEAKAVRRKLADGLQFRYWAGTARKAVVVKPQKDGRSQQVSLQLEWAYGGVGQIEL